MRYADIAKRFWLPLVMFSLYMTAVLFRPLFPVDETRYMTVAWEMWLRHGWLDPLTVNFAPYHHKPPVLFWLINLSWAIFGISRWAGLIPVCLSALSCVYLTGRLGQRLLPSEHHRQHIWLLMVGSVPFLMYGTLMMFDITLCAFVLGALIHLYDFAQQRRWRSVIWMGLCVGMGVLTKGPVAYLYVMPVALLAPFWHQDFHRARQWYGGLGTALLVSVIPVLFWVVPILMASDADFAKWLIWNQTAGRVTGNFTAAHARPIWFYLPLVPIMFAPWIFMPAFWRHGTSLRHQIIVVRHTGLRFLMCWIVPVFVAFSLISGKQPHYLVPLLPGTMLVVGYCLRGINTATLAKISGGMVVMLIGGQIIAAQTIFNRYTLTPIAEIIQKDPMRPLAFVQNYHGELGFTGRHTQPIDEQRLEDIEQWFTKHPNGWAIIRFKDGEEKIAGLKKIHAYPYRGRGKNIGIFAK